MHACTHTHAYKCTCHVHCTMYMYACTHAHTDVYTCTYTYTYSRTYTHARMHARTHARMQQCKRTQSLDSDIRNWVQLRNADKAHKTWQRMIWPTVTEHCYHAATKALTLWSVANTKNSKTIKWDGTSLRCWVTVHGYSSNTIGCEARTTSVKL